jgi:hypothetical protein
MGQRGIVLLAAAAAAVLLLAGYARGQTVTVHMIQHTHDDVGWQTTVQGYYTSSVRDIITRAYNGLMANTIRTYTYVEVAFFQLWWNEQTDAVKNNVKQLVASGRLEFTNAGWSMNDEAVCHQSDIIDNMALGHLWLQAMFGTHVKPTTGWMIDPFGHTAGQAWLYAKMGYNMFLFGRAPSGTPQPYHFVWRPFNSFTKNNPVQDMFTYFHNGYCGNPPNTADATAMTNWANARKSDASKLGVTDVIDLYGCDFTRETFSSSDAVITYLNAHPELGVKAEYSTPVKYYTAVHAAGVKHDLFEPPNDEFFPYWTGFFTSKQNFKQLVRKSSAYFHTATALQALAPRASTWTDQVKRLNVLWMGLGVCQHHDGITGTSQPAVYDDYNSRLNYGTTQAEGVVSEVIGSILGQTGVQACPSGRFPGECPGTSSGVTAKGTIVNVANPLAWTRTEWVHLELPATYTYTVYDSAGKLVESQEVAWKSGTVQLVFQASLPALGTSSYVVMEKAASPAAVKAAAGAEAVGDFVVENDLVSLYFDTVGDLKAIRNKASNANTTIGVEMMWYKSAADGNDGAYDFKANPDTPYAFPGQGKSTPVVVKGTLFTDVVVNVDPQSSVTQRIRLYRGESFVETVSSMGPIYIGDGIGKNVIMRFTSGIQSSDLFFTDSSGLELTQNQRGKWKFNANLGLSAGKNYYPMTILSTIKDTNTQLVYLTDKAEGASSMASGSLESMVYRRLLKGDGKGMDTPLNDTTPLTTVHWFMVDTPAAASKAMRPLSLRIYNPPVVTVSPGTGATVAPASWSPLSAPLPANVHIQNLQVFVANFSHTQCPTCDIPPPSGKNPPDQPVDPSSLADGTVVLRLAHIYAVGEDATLAQPVTVDFTNLFKDWTITDSVEQSMSLNQPQASMTRLQWATKLAKRSESATVVTIDPMDIRSFVLKVQHK